jgi:hypothetical protein
MRRRKFLIGAGALFAGSAAAVGTGAFSAAEARDRAVEVETSGDRSGLVTLDDADGPIGEYVEYDGEKIEFDATQKSSYEGGGEPGLNRDAVFYYDSAFEVQIAENASDQPTLDEYEVTIDDGAADGVEFYVGDSRDTSAGVDGERLLTKSKGNGLDYDLSIGFVVDTADISGTGTVGSIDIEVEGVGGGGDV